MSELDPQLHQQHQQNQQQNQQQHQHQQPQQKQHQPQKQSQPWQPQHQQQQWQTITIRYGELKYGCLADPTCPMRFSKIEMQAVHHRESHMLQRCYICSVCNSENNSSQQIEGTKLSFKTRKSLRFHQENHHKSK